MRLALPALALLAAPTLAGTITVPTDQPDLFSALQAAGPGEVIVVKTAANQDSQGLVIDKPLTIIGDPVCRIGLSGFTDGLQLAGPGTGEVILSGLDISYEHSNSNGSQMLWGSGFDRVRLFECTLRHDNLQPDGTISVAYPAVDLPTVKQLTVIGCDLLGGPTEPYSCMPGTGFPDGREGILAPQATVLLVDSFVRGGTAGIFTGISWSPCPASLVSWGGSGGDGVVCAEMHAWNSSVSGGSGITWESSPSGYCIPWETTIPCGTKPSGSPFSTGGTLSINPCSRLGQISPEIPIGGTWHLDWDALTPGCVPNLGGTGLLFASAAAPIQPFSVSSDWVFLDPASSVLMALFSSTQTQQFSFPVPADSSLVGLPVSAQVLVSNGRLSGPTSGILAP